MSHDLRVEISRSSINIFPLSGVSSRKSNLTKVVLPAPEEPVKKTNSPSFMSKEISSNAEVDPNFFTTFSKVIIGHVLIQNLHSSHVHKPTCFFCTKRLSPNLNFLAL